MRKLLFIVAALFCLQVGGHAQTPVPTECPSVVVTAPAGIVDPGQPIHFEAGIWGRAPKDIRYNWTVKRGTLHSGQGTKSIVTYPESENDINVTAAVEVDGLPEGCHRIASETYTMIVDNFDPILMFEVSTSKLDVDLELCASNTVLPRYNAIVKELEENRTNQAHIIFSHKSDTSSDVSQTCERGVIQFFTNAGIDRSRITSRSRSSEQESVQFWRVPPGSENPVCVECERTVACPEIAVTGPSGITSPGDSMEYKAQISGDVRGSVRYEWTVSAGQIIEGQGTLAIKVRAPETEPTGLTATINIEGLPGGCPASASETAQVAAILDPVLVDEFVSEGLQLEKGRLEAASSTLKERPDGVLYIIEHFPPNTSGFDIRAKQRKLSEFLTEYTKLNEKSLKIVTATGPEFRTRIYRIVSGSEFPEP